MNPGNRLRIVLRMGSLLWAVCTLVPASLLYVVANELGPLAVMPHDVALPGLGVAGLLFIASLVVPANPRRVLPVFVSIGIALSALLMSTAGMASAFLLVPTLPTGGKTIAASLFVGAAICWCIRALTVYKRSIVRRQFIENEFTHEQSQIVMRQPVRTRLVSTPVADRTFLDRLFNRLGSHVAILVPMVYPLQRLLVDANGLTAALLLLAVLSSPLAVYILGRIVCAGYLFAYRVWLLEHEQGKPVVFAEALR